MMRPLLLVLVLFSGACAFRGLAPGLTRGGAAVAVSAASPEEARREAMTAVLDLFVAPGSSSARTASELLRAGAEEFIGGARLKAGKGVVEVRFDKVLRALDKRGLLRPDGFSAGEPRVFILIAEPVSVLDLGIGPTADALRRGLSAYGIAALDGRDSLSGVELKGKSAAELVASAGRAGADWLVIAAAAANAEPDAESGMWRSRAGLVVDQYEVRGGVAAGQWRSESTALDVSSAAARGKALEQAGEEAASRVAAAVARSRGGRSEASLTVIGNAELPRLKALLASLRKIEGVDGACLGSWGGEEGAAGLRVFLTGIKADGLAARLLRLDPTLTLLSVESDSGRLAVEAAGRAL